MKSALGRLIRRFLPPSLRNWEQRRFLERIHRDDATNKDLFSKIYSERKWGEDSDGHPFYSGTGSEPYNTGPYIEYVNEFVSKNRISSIVDIGCGDFRVGQQIILQGASYIGVDIVKDLIDFNSENFSSGSVSFVCMDIVTDELPKAELVLVRQVLQHLGNNDVILAINKIRSYNFAIITDEIPNNKTHSINKDVVRGGTRFERNSALYVERPPFDLTVDVVLDYPNHRGDRRLRTVLFDRARHGHETINT